MPFELSLFLFHRNSRPVANELVGTGQRIEQGRFSAIWISCKCNLNSHSYILLSFILSFFMFHPAYVG